MLRHSLIILVLSIAHYGISQSISGQDTVRQLNEVVVHAYLYNRPISLVPASIGILGPEQLYRFNESTYVPSLNTIPGVRMEERSPGSYRLSIRGSTIRSPFGVRNVKVYWNNIPLTDPGGNTYVNQLDPAMIGSAEIIKGPGSSLYGAGTGGVLLMSSPVIEDGRAFKTVFQAGSFGGELFQASYEQASTKSSHQVQVLHQQSDGYRNQTRMSRDVVNSVFHFNLNDEQVLETFVFYSDLFYETPGGLTLAEFQTDPTQARPAAGPSPGAEEQYASVHLQSFYMGVAHEFFFSDHVHSRTSVYGNLVKFENPSIRNYEHRNEQSFGLRSVVNYDQEVGAVNLSLVGGGEFQSGFSPIKTYENLQGTEGSLLIDDEVKIFQYSLFGQVDLRWNKFTATAGLSFNSQKLNFHRLSDPVSEPEQIKYDPVLMPRLALLMKASEKISFFGSLSSGFSPPTLSEINASNGIFNKELRAETGISYEMGIRLKLVKEILQADVTAFSFALDETIVIRREADGAEYFVNVGETKQKGIEILIRYNPVISIGKWLNKFSLWTSYANNHFRFGDYVKGSDDFSGNELTGSPENVLSGGLDVSTKPGIYFRATCLYSSKLPLNDANTVYADSYVLPGLRVGFQRKRYEIYAGADNLLDENYSLGNDLNAFGGRYYNTAPARNYYGGIKINLSF